ncbi:hypothetical protein [Vermiculatibacterium agrestimuris]|uniref:RCC1 domain-containing protein n=1 Tax=Vermiculatibacterium agrestimuris TaxID=2941519 RepID=UPI00203C5A6D|nr:hypothetical protein [Vermiculatibacterium agrestimuris]
MNTKKRWLAALWGLALTCALALPAGAAENPGAFNLAAAGDRHTLALKTDGSLWAWGGGSMGQLGDGGSADRAAPVKVMDFVTSMAAGGNHSLAVQADGSLWAWGNNASGQLGLGAQDNAVHATPAKVMDGVSAVYAGASHSLAIKTDGSLWAWGANRSGQLGIGSAQDQTTPVKVMDAVTAVAAGEAHTLALKADGSLWAWGANLAGQLGADTPGGDPMADCLTPIQIMRDVSAVSASRAYSLAIKTDGSLWAWGDNQYGQLGNGGTGNMAVMQPGAGSTFCQTTPIQILSEVSAVSAGGSSRACHVLALKTDSSLWGWGSNVYGQLAPATMQKLALPVRLDGNIQQIQAGGEHSLAIRAGSLLTWGSNSSGQLGNGTFQSVSAPVSVPDPSTGEPSPSQTPSTEKVYPQPVTAYARTQEVDLDGAPVVLQAYALKDGKGYETNYVKLRDAAFLLNGSPAQFQVSWSASVTSILTGFAYSSNGSEMHTPFSGDRQGRQGTPTVIVNGREVPLSAILLTDDKGGGYTYFKLRDLGQALGFNVGWNRDTGRVYIETGTPYAG